MVATVTPYTDTRNRAAINEGYDGVVRIAVDGYYGSGVLLYGGRAVLTAAHLFKNGATMASVQFETSAGTQSVNSASIAINPAYDALNSNNDLALVWLATPAPVTAKRYALYRGSDEIGKSFTFAGYGIPGTGALGEDTSYSGMTLRQKAANQFDADAATLKQSLGGGMNWTPAAGTQLIADFDDGAAAQDALGRLINRVDTGLGVTEGLITRGDSGGPAFINGQIAGIASYTSSLARGTVAPDLDTETNSSFGEIAFWQRVSAYQQWIDQSVRAHDADAPTKASDVKKTVIEGNGSTTFAYFLLEFTGMRSDPNQLLSVDFATRDGSAKAGLDYLAVHSTLMLYPNENQAVIPVEIIGDFVPEPDETFYLDVTNPVGGSFGAGVLTLTAMRTILGNDGWSFG